MSHMVQCPTWYMWEVISVSTVHDVNLCVIQPLYWFETWLIAFAFFCQQGKTKQKIKNKTLFLVITSTLQFEITT